ncbi:MAG TPA: hypothetical protein VM327_07880 [Candidatus Thermoplasmatota archaeon]|nr:hypothetical protein [Candidatus Thermoplasmatota archaeon]
MHDHGTTIALISVTGLLSLVLTALALGAWHRTGNRKLGFVAAAFWVFVIKAAVTAYSLWTSFLGHEDLELAGALLDVVIVVLLVAPFLGGALRKPGSA